MDAQAGRLSAEQQETTNSLSTRIDEHERQLRQLRQRLIESHTAVQDRFNEIEEQFVRREDLEQVRQDHAAQAAALVEQIETNRHAVQDAMQDITERFRLIHTRLEGLDESAQADSTGLSELRRTQAEDVGNLLRQLEDQRRAVQEQFDRILSGWSRSQQEIEHLRSTAANVNALDELRKRQHRQSEQVLNVIAEQRQNVEVLIQAIGGRCDEMLKRIDALPANIATTDDVKALHAQTLDQKAMIEAAIRGVSMQCEQTAGALRNLETSAASVEDIRQIRESQAANLDQIVQRLDGQSSEYQQEFETLNQRWTHLREELHTLAQSSTSVKQFETAERMITQDLGSLKERLAEVAQRRQKDARILVDAVQRLTERVKGLEELDRPMPVKIELRPRAAEELGELNKSAETRAADMRALLATADAMGSQLRDSSTHVEEIIRDWLNTARQVNEQSEQLRTSAVSSGSILQALRKCNETIDGKLKSPAWHGQLRRAEEIAARLEQALPHYAHVEETIQHWEKRRGEAEHFVDRLESLLAEAGKVTARLGRVGVMMAGVAGKASSLAETVESARAHDEQLRPARSPGANGGNRAVQDVDWPRYRTHAAAQ